MFLVNVDNFYTYHQDFSLLYRNSMNEFIINNLAYFMLVLELVSFLKWMQGRQLPALSILLYLPPPQNTLFPTTLSSNDG
ncbi:hypothetical protein Nmul_A0929 [Nitrosospira multiformis ATCC 25196]|uniref:Uncharacterized protein n=1 Tax=Nitrosospira multiformis (strain ATCC 25196 / NCIMB 11849 / C 71) TaxID=323848 RepID=Q2YAI9_NITMU|nr:hypothetical protein Nmul_A0929 [Nitrosospira multiformis ATCC 25196]